MRLLFSAGLRKTMRTLQDEDEAREKFESHEDIEMHRSVHHDLLLFTVVDQHSMSWAIAGLFARANGIQE